MGKKQELERLLAEENPSSVGVAFAEELAARLAPISKGYLRRLLISSGIPLDPLVEGVRQDNWEHLERSLNRLADIYESGDQSIRTTCRNLVIQAKDHARLSAWKCDAEKRAMKEEMAAWMLVWLENPGVFGVWARLRLTQGWR